MRVFPIVLAASGPSQSLPRPCQRKRIGTTLGALDGATITHGCRVMIAWWCARAIAMATATATLTRVSGMATVVRWSPCVLQRS